MSTLIEILNELDPDWGDRFAGDADRAAHFYQTYNRQAWRDAKAFADDGEPDLDDDSADDKREIDEIEQHTRDWDREQSPR